jgi:anti-sigma regulatory factor (Ser/Thr protein kinase)
MTESATAPYKSTMVMRNDPAELGKLTQWIVGACAAAHIPQKTSFAVQLCLDEAVANILQHGSEDSEGSDGSEHGFEYAAQPGAGGVRASTISASLERGDAGVCLDIEDDGEAFDPTAFAPRAIAETLELMPVGGLGIHFMRQYSSRMEYSRSGGRNRLRLTFSAQQGTGLRGAVP